MSATTAAVPADQGQDAMNGDLLDLLDVLAALDERPAETLHAELGRGHMAITVGSPTPETFVFLTDLGGRIHVGGWPHSAWITPDQAREVAAHLLAFADRERA